MSASRVASAAYLEQQALAAETVSEGQGGRIAGLLAELVAHGVFDAEPEALRGYPTLESYAAAAQELRAYYRSAERATYIQPLDTPPIIGGPVSLEWFRKRVPTPEGATAHAWLGYCEWIIRTSELRPDSPGEFYARIQGVTYYLRFRREDGVHPALTWAELLRK